MRKGGGRPRGPLRTFEVKPPMNEKLNFQEIRVVQPAESGNGKDEPVGVLSLQEGLALARDREVDLILINENASPPVCKLIDYSKWRFQKEKKAKELKKSAKSTEVKEIQMSYKIDVGDLAVRQRACLKFLKGGNRIKVSVMFRGREQTHVDLGYELLTRFSSTDAGISEWGAFEGKPKRDGRMVVQFMNVRPERMKAEVDRMKQKEREAKNAKKKADKLAHETGVAAAAVEEEEEEEEISDEELKSLNQAAMDLEDEEEEGEGEGDILEGVGGGGALLDELFG